MENFNFTLNAEQFIVQGIPFEFIAKFDDVNVKVISSVEKREKNVILTIKGDYKRGSSVEITIGNDDLNLSNDQMLIIARESMIQYIPLFIFDDYPTSLKKIAADEKMDALEKNSAPVQTS